MSHPSVPPTIATTAGVRDGGMMTRHVPMPIGSSVSIVQEARNEDSGESVDSYVLNVPIDSYDSYDS